MEDTIEEKDMQKEKVINLFWSTQVVEGTGFVNQRGEPPRRFESCLQILRRCSSVFGRALP